MRPYKIDPKKGPVYVQIDGRKIKLYRLESVQLKINMKKPPFIYSRLSERKLHLTSWRKKVWAVWEHNTWYQNLVRFEKRNAAIMWLKRYGKENITYRLERQHGVSALVRVVNGYVYFYDQDSGLKISAESKHTNPYAIRNN